MLFEALGTEISATNPVQFGSKPFTATLHLQPALLYCQMLEGISSHSKAIMKTLSTGRDWTISTKKPPLFFRLSLIMHSQCLCCLISHCSAERKGKSAGPHHTALVCSTYSTQEPQQRAQHKNHQAIKTGNTIFFNS